MLLVVTTHSINKSAIIVLHVGECIEQIKHRALEIWVAKYYEEFKFF